MQLELKSNNREEVVISVAGSISSANAEEFSEGLLELRQKNPEGTLCLDIENLEYISSAGLRGVLKLQKYEKGTLCLMNATPEVMEIFEVTGFTQIVNVKKAYKQISVNGCEIIGRGANGVVYRLDEDKIVKVYQKEASIQDITRERELAQKAFILGIPTAIAYDVVKIDDCFGVVFELLDAKSLSQTIVDHPENYDQYAREYVQVYKQFHNTKGDDHNFPKIKELYYRYIDGCKDWYSEEEMKKLMELVDSIPDCNTLIHGDYHARNIMVQNGELLMIDMGDVSIGHPIFDFLATAATQANLVELNPDYAKIHTGMPVEYIKRLWNDLLKIYFSDKSESEIDIIDKQIRIFSKLKVALAPVLARGVGEEIVKGSVMDAKQNLFPMIDELIGTVNW